MNSYVVYLDLPTIPPVLLEDEISIINKPPKPQSNISASYRSFQTRLVNSNLEKYVQDQFGHDCFVQYQIVSQGLSIHKDKGRNVAFNYLINTGGPKVITAFFDDEHRCIYTEKIRPYCWHRMRTDVYHCVYHIEYPRIAVSTQIPNYQWGDAVNLPSNA